MIPAAFIVAIFLIRNTEFLQMASECCPNVGALRVGPTSIPEKTHGNSNGGIVSLVRMLYFGKEIDGLGLRILRDLVQPKYRSPDQASFIKY